MNREEADTDAAILTVAAHELKNALSGISVALMRCEQRLAGGGAVTKDDLAVARAEVRRLSRLITDLLDGGRVDLGTFDVRLAAVDLGDLARTGAATFAA
ncbi:MAG: histidine kinase dimerization/phospho-acceptor domain-containing protein, partial [Pseudomonadota bacterium]